MKSLFRLVLSKISYVQAKQACVMLKSVFEEEWDFWCAKCCEEFNVSPSFFDILMGCISPSQRYLQISSYFGINKDCAVRVYPDGTIEGVYESYLGVKISLEQQNKEMYDFFLSRLPIEKRKKFRYKVKTKPQEEQTFASLIYTNDCNLIERKLHKYINLPEGFSLHRDVPENYWYTRPKINLDDRYSYIIMDEEDILNAFEACFRMGNVKLADLLIHVYYDLEDLLSETANYGDVFYSSPNPEGSWTIFCRYIKHERDCSLAFAEAWKMGSDEDSLSYSFYKAALGNVAFLSCFLEDEKVRQLNVNEDKYPLSSKLLLGSDVFPSLS